MTVATLTGLWWLLSGGELASWIIGVPAIATAAWAASRLRGNDRVSISLAGAARFVPLFAWASLRGGLDVAWRTFAPSARVRPGFIVFQTLLGEETSRAFFASCVNLLPGTLTANLEGDRLDIHQLDITADNTAALRRLERAVQRLLPPRGAP